MSKLHLKFEKDYFVVLKTITFPRKRNFVVGYVFITGPYYVYTDATKTPLNVFPNKTQLTDFLDEKG
jgi:hypothetical protein